MPRGAFLLGLAGLCAGVAAGMPATAAADEDDGPVRLMDEPFGYTDVVDAFDEEDPYDAHIEIGFRRETTSGTIERQVDGPRAGGTPESDQFRDVAEWEHVRNVFDLGVDIGLYRDLALYARLPVVISDDRDLSLPGGRSEMDVQGDLQDPRGNPLFSVPFNAPTRSGLDYFAVGLAWAILNQHRSVADTVPTWVVMAEGRFNVSEEMHACKSGGSCNVSPAEEPEDGGSPGVGRGTNALKVETRASRRFRYVEPYMGLSFKMEWPARADEFFTPRGDLAGFMNTLPPRVGELTAGVAVIPWERRGRSQRLAIDVRFIGTYISEGHSYSPLFDPLGTSTSPYLDDPKCEGIPQEGGPSCGGGGLREVEFYGQTDTEAHGRVGGRLAVHMRALRYLRVGLGFGLYYTTPYLMTFTDACNPNVDGDKNPARQGRCRGGIINPHHRSAIDVPGNRFRLDGAFTYNLFATATAQF